MVLEDAMREAPVIAITRGVRPEEIEAIAEALFSAGVRVIETPLNSPSPFRTIETLARLFGDRVICGGGTIVAPEQVDAIADVGARIAVSPNANPAVIDRALARGIIPVPGVFTPTEAFAAIEAGATSLKLFPAASAGPAHLGAIRAVLPPRTRTYAVGGVRLESMTEWALAGVDGFGLGSELYTPGQTPEATFVKARAAMAAAIKAFEAAAENRALAG